MNVSITVVYDHQETLQSGHANRKRLCPRVFLLLFPQNILHRVTVKGDLSLRAQCLQLRQTGIYPARMRRRP